MLANTKEGWQLSREVGRVDILVVDDEPANLLALEAVLADLGQNIIRAGSGDEALRRVLETDFAVIIMDLRMPGLSGFEAAQLIRTRSRSRSTPIIFLTAADGDGFSATEAYALGAVDYLTKPLVPMILRAKVAVFVELYQKTEALKAAERERAAVAVQESEERLKLAVDIARMGTFDIDLLTDVVVMNEPGRVLLGFASTQTTFARVQERFHPDDRDGVMSRVLAAFEPTGSGNFELEHRILRPSGEERWLRVRGQTFFTGAGSARKAVRCLGAFLDVTEAKRSEEALRASEEEFRTNFERAGVGKAHADPTTGQLVRVNAAFCTLMGYTTDELLKLTIREVTHPDERDASDERFGALMRGTVPQYAVEKRYVRKDGATIWVRVTATVVRTPAGVPIRACAIIEDITARKRAEAALAEESRRKDEFLAILAHELRNPLAPISNGLELLKMYPAGGPAAEKARTRMDRQLAHLIRLIDDLMDISRVSRGKLELRKDRVTVRMVVENALDASAPLLESAGHQISVTIPSEPLVLHADAVRITQIVSNLLNNAAKYTPPGGCVGLAVEREGGTAVIRISDSGVGLEADMLPKVFEMFTQVGKTLDRAQGGLGIGLALVKRLVEMHGGAISAESPGLGHGSTFTVKLPLAESTRTLP
ncbi:response regulator sensory box histidine kinase : PAS domain S-box protein OS=Massilia sp. LC238 GN=FG94_02777 PE=4 SV=1: Response_reg: PAS_3: PAS_9: HisKA: HATPase_c [Gemmata massiliana]|uniref:histidine kinase n=1 Tax=Gemmata massiliana TaxID=1210884 RepID=A0A6P2D1X3_9BACT|nr:PAS domain S-box protein [Gemmata massiliana]VTR94395.1 response regulator sensory box histidine kinase : PAS domain S-box protein OS=Massilia sp. LC238 GN=FG94_02777 PE=4 SV=1: Response_reg: PAS_3: PAS_9: HisKA: HATPase_c [Gemmata massiliana]